MEFKKVEEEKKAEICLKFDFKVDFEKPVYARDTLSDLKKLRDESIYWSTTELCIGLIKAIENK